MALAPLPGVTRRTREHMTTVALITWLAAASFGLLMFAIWLIEYGGKGTAGASRLPAAVVFGHVVLAIAGLTVWIVYLIADDDRLAVAAFGILLGVAFLGLTMLRRWISVYRESTVTLSVGAEPDSAPALRATPAEGNFPIAVVVGHGLFAGATIVLVLLTVLGVG
jgi:uncharacterized membrane protein